MVWLSNWVGFGERECTYNICRAEGGSCVKSPPKYCKEVRGVPYLQHYYTGTNAQKKFAPHWYIGGGEGNNEKKWRVP